MEREESRRARDDEMEEARVRREALRGSQLTRIRIRLKRR